jgi:ATP-dependent DNA ligase
MPSATVSTSRCKAASPACRPDLFTRSGDLAKEGRVGRFIEPMECMPVVKIPEGDVWSYELKLDGYRLVAVKTNGSVTLYSRRGAIFPNASNTSFQAWLVSRRKL